MAMTISVIIPTHDRPRPLQLVVEALACQSHKPDELIIVNDGAAEIDAGLPAILARAGIDLKVIRRAEPSSAASRNAGLAIARGDIVACFDDDMLLDCDLLKNLLEIYRLDSAGVIAGVTLAYRDEPETWQGLLWETIAGALGRMRWAPRRQRCRYVQLDKRLAGKLEPTARLSSGAMSLQGQVARWARFDEQLTGYAFGEDRDLSYRLGRELALFRTRQVWIRHAPAPGGRGSMFQRGQAYVDNSLRIAARGVEGGAGTVVLIGYDFAGTILQYAIWGLLTGQRSNLAYAAGIASALARRAWTAVRRSIAGPQKKRTTNEH